MTVPRVLKTSIITTLALSVAANAAVFSIVPLEIWSTTNAVAIVSPILSPSYFVTDGIYQVFGQQVLGRPGALIYAWIVCLAGLGGLHAVTFSAGRLTQAAGARQYLPKILKADANATSTTGRLFGRGGRDVQQNIPR